MTIDVNAISGEVIGAAIEVHRQLGPGLLESAYEVCLAHELDLRQTPYQRQKPIAVQYKGIALDCGYRLDFLVRELVIVELKSVDLLLPIHDAQVITYLKLANCRLGILLNFNVKAMKDGIKRLAFNL